MNININTTPKAASSKIVVKLFSYEPSLIENAVFVIRNGLGGTGVFVRGPIPMPTRRKVFTVNRSPHVDKKSREHFQIKTHIRIMELMNCNNAVIERLLKVVLPTGVEIKIRYYDN